ncbi:MAG: GYD domain-containing protein [Nitrospirota bacterium]|nr:MAG: GYD domain-containing protein [Nitrospirota bacterium]
MPTYIILSRFVPGAFAYPQEFKKIAKTVSEKIKKECPDVRWKDSFATMGRFDVVDIVESDDPRQIERAAMIIRSYGHSITETMTATAWKDFLSAL